MHQQHNFFHYVYTMWLNICAKIQLNLEWKLKCYVYGIATLFSVLPLENEQQLLELSNDNNTIQVLKANIQTNNFD